MKEYLGVAQAARELGIDRMALTYRLRNDFLPGSKFNNQWVVKKTDLPEIARYFEVKMKEGSEQ